MNLISVSNLESSGLKMPKSPLLKNALMHYLRIPGINKLYRNNLSNTEELEFIDRLLTTLNITIDISHADLQNIPSQGAFMAIANHPFGFLDGLIMIKLMARHRPEFKVLANYFLSEFKPISNYFIPLNPFTNHHPNNRSGLMQAMRQLSNGSPIGLFPAGEVSTMQKGFKNIEDKPWDDSIIRFIAKTNQPVVPIYFEGHNSLPFHLLGKIHPYLRTLSLPAEFFKMKNQTIKVRIGKAIQPEDYKEFANTMQSGAYLRARLNALGKYNQPISKKRFKLSIPSIVQPLAEAVPTELIEAEVAQLKEKGKLLLSKSNYDLFITESTHIPNILNELGRLREKTFREVGEGTNKALDLDVYDTFYKHLFLYDNSVKIIVGAYRLGKGDEILAHHSRHGFYVETLFDLAEPMKPILQETLELGRSFVVKEQQQKPLPLFMLWQGILHILKQNPQYKYLMGPLSISNDFSTFSKDVMTAYIRRHYFNNTLAQWVTPKKEFKVKSDSTDINLILEQHSSDLHKLDKLISAIEPNAMKIPVLLKQYIRQNARIIGFNVDPHFNNSLDGLMILDLNELPQETLEFLKGR